VQLEGLGELKNSITLSGIEPTDVLSSLHFILTLMVHFLK
jgi:hypothetical protein